MITDRLIAIERELVPDAEHMINDAKRAKQRLETEAGDIRKQLLMKVNKHDPQVLFKTSDPNVMVEVNQKEQSVTILEARNET